MKIASPGPTAWVSRKILRPMQLAARRPHVWIIPVLVAGLMIGVGVWAVVENAHQYTESSRQRAQVHVEAACSNVQSSILQATMPLMQLSDWINHTLDYTTIYNNFADRVPNWWPKGDTKAMTVSIAPFGKVSNVYPNTPEFRWGLGLDLLTRPSIYAQVIDSIKNGFLTMADPQFRDEWTILMTLQMPIMVKNVSQTVTWGIPNNTTNCPPGVCYNATTRTRWWGNAGMTLNVTTLFSSSGPISNLAAAGYKVQVWRPPNTRLNETDWKLVKSDEGTTLPADAIRGNFTVANVDWSVYAWEDDWHPSWEVPLIVTVVIVSVFCGLLIFCVLLSWEEHRVLLRSLLPEEVIDRMRTQFNWKAIDEEDGKVNLVVTYDIQTPAEQMISIIHQVMSNQNPPMAQLVAVKQALQRSADVYRPAYHDLQTRIVNAPDLDEETQRALVQQLAGTERRSHDPEVMVTMEDMDDELEHGSWDGTPRVPGVQGDSGTVSKAHTGDLQTAPDLHAMLHDLITRSRAPCAAAASIGGDSSTVLAVWPRQDAPDENEKDAVTVSLPSKRARSMGQLANVVPEKPITDDLYRVLSTTNNWGFDAYALEAASNGRPLSALGYYLLHTSGLMDFAKMPPRSLANFLLKIEAGYPHHPYHNSRHAADVLQNFHMLLVHGGLTPHYCDQLTLLACYLSAIIHDYDHRGVSNDFLVNSSDKLAVRYNDRSPMENHHLAAAWALLHKPGTNCLNGLTRVAWDKLRKMVIELVLATDMKQHMAIMGQFNTLTATTANKQESDSGASLQKAPSVDRDQSGGGQSSVSPPSQPTITESEKILSLQVALKCADLGNLSAPLPVYLRWLENLEAEYFLQGDAERAKGLAISPLCDRLKEGVTKCQVGFYEFVVLPLFTAFCQKFPSSKPMLKAAVSNYQYWKDGKDMLRDSAATARASSQQSTSSNASGRAPQ